MDPGSETAAAPGEYAGLHFIDGTSYQRSYAVVARCGHIFRPYGSNINKLDGN